MLENLFHLSDHNTTVKTECIAGCTTFMAMAYIIFVNPHILGDAGMPFEGVVFATCIGSAIGSILMGLYANYPVALAPGMGLNAYFAYTVVQQMGISWQVALGAVFLSGVIFILLTVFHIWRYIVDAIPDTIKFSTAVGIGIFIAFIGLQNGGIIAANPSTLVTLKSPLVSKASILTFFGLFLISALLARKVKGAILLGILGTTILAFFLGVTSLPAEWVKIPRISETFLQLDIPGAFRLGLIDIVFAFFFVDLFDNVGTLLGVSQQAGLLREGKLPRINKALFSAAVGSTFGALSGTSTVTSYIESASGVAEGGRTGLTAIVTGFLFILAMFFSPIAGIIPEPATASALIIVGYFMIKIVREIQWDEITEAVPAFITIISIPLTFSIANGIALGFITYPFIKTLGGKYREVSIATWILALFFLFRYFYLSNS